MERQGEEVHLDPREARAGGGPRSMRTVLMISVALVIVVLSALWIGKAATTADVTDPAQRAAPASPTTG
jgi:hypothetical protein